MLEVPCKVFSSYTNVLTIPRIKAHHTQKGGILMATLPLAAHGDVLPIVKITPKYEGKGESRHVVGVQFYALLLFDSCARVPITVLNLDPAALPAPDVVGEHNMKLNFLTVRFKDLVITFTGGEYGAINYRGTASGAEIVQGK